MMPPTVLMLQAGTPTIGIWCPSCALPSGYQVDIYGLFESGPIKLTHIRECYDCGARIPAEKST